MKVKMNGKSMQAKMSSGSIVEIGTLNTTTNNIINGENTDELVTDLVNDYLDEHKELLGNDTLEKDAIASLTPYEDGSIASSYFYHLKRNGVTVSSVGSTKLYQSKTKDNGSVGYTAKYLNEKLTFDDSLDSNSTNAVQNSAIVSALENLKENEAVATAQQLESSLYTESTEPYIFRPSHYGADRKSMTIAGGSLAVNQLNGNRQNSSEESGITFTNNGDGSWTITGTSTAVVSKNIDITHSAPIPEGHVVYFASNSVEGSRSTFWLTLSQNDGSHSNFYGESVEKLDGDKNRIYIRVANGYDCGSGITMKPMVIDLTQMFGSTIADYIYSLEQANAGDGVAWFRKYFPKEYYPYNAGEIQSVELSEHKTVGFNQWDEEWEVGGYNTNGGKQAYNDRIRSKNMIKVLPNTTYGKNIGMYICEYDGEQNFVRRVDLGAAKKTFTTSETTKYITFNTYSSYGTVYNSDICINLSWDGERDGEYEPYQQHTYPLSELELRGITKLDSSNNLVYDGDTLESDGTVTRKYGIVDLGALNWQANGSTDNIYEFAVALTNKAYGFTNMLCDKLTVTDTNADVEAVRGRSNSSTISVRIASLTTPAAFKQAMSGVMLVYELATPTTEQAEPFADIQIVDDFGTEEFSDTRDWQIPVGTVSKYQKNLRELVDKIADTPTADGTYVLKAVVSGGKATLKWVAE